MIELTSEAIIRNETISAKNVKKKFPEQSCLAPPRIAGILRCEIKEDISPNNVYSEKAAVLKNKCEQYPGEKPRLSAVFWGLRSIT